MGCAIGDGDGLDDGVRFEIMKKKKKRLGCSRAALRRKIWGLLAVGKGSAGRVFGVFYWRGSLGSLGFGKDGLDADRVPEALGFRQ